MPFSDSVLDDVIRQFCREIPLGYCLDIGVGAGKYGKLVREISPSAHIIGIEIESAYVEMFNLKEVYDEVRCVDASDLITSDVDSRYDLVLLGDCLEHMRKSDGIDLLNFLVYRTRYLLAIYPEKYRQGSWNGFVKEAHISFWHVGDFAGLEFSLVRRQSQVAIAVNGYLLESPHKSVMEILKGME